MRARKTLVFRQSPNFPCRSTQMHTTLPLARAYELPQRERMYVDRKWGIKSRDDHGRISVAVRYECLDGVGDDKIQESKHVPRICYDACAACARINVESGRDRQYADQRVAGSGDQANSRRYLPGRDQPKPSQA